MTRVLRTDVSSLRPPRKLADGRLVADAQVARVGILTYRNPDGSERRELRLPEEVFRPDSLDAFAGVPVTEDHPGILNAGNARRHAVGAVLSPRRDGDWLSATLSIYDDATIKAMERGKRQVSAGYTVSFDPTPGVHPIFGRYDGVQRDIVPNHVAIVATARAGEGAQVRMDSCEIDRAHDGERATFNPQVGGATTTRMAAVEPKTLDEAKAMLVAAADQIAKAVQRADAADAKLNDERVRADTATATAAQLQRDCDRLTAERSDQEDPCKLRDALSILQMRFDESEQKRADAESPERLQKLVRERVAIESAALTVLGSRETFDSCSNRELQCAVIAKLEPGVDLGSDRSDEYVSATFAQVMRGRAARDREYARLREIVAPAGAPAKRDDARSAREEMIERNRNAWRTPAVEVK